MYCTVHAYMYTACRGEIGFLIPEKHAQSPMKYPSSQIWTYWEGGVWSSAVKMSFIQYTQGIHVCTLYIHECKEGAVSSPLLLFIPSPPAFPLPFSTFPSSSFIFFLLPSFLSHPLLKGVSHQIRLTKKGYHWPGLNEDAQHWMFENFKLYL